MTRVFWDGTSFCARFHLEAKKQSKPSLKILVVFVIEVRVGSVRYHVERLNETSNQITQLASTTIEMVAWSSCDIEKVKEKYPNELWQPTN